MVRVDLGSPVQPPKRLGWLQALKQPQIALGWPLGEWERIVRLSRRLRLLGRLAESLLAADLLGCVPAQPRRHLVGELRLSRARTAATLWTIDRVTAALNDASYPRVLLKGAAYVGQDLSISTGRLPSDLDILVPKIHISDAQLRLTSAGWNEVELDSHDRRYYYEWSHEVPPMWHPSLTVELDLHHNILPPVARTRVDADLLLARLQPSKWPAWQVLHPLDQVLHSAAHLFLDSEARDRIRDLVDLDGLFRHFGADPEFWRELPERAQELGLGQSLALASHFTTAWLGTPMPEGFLRTIAVKDPTGWRRASLHAMFDRILMPTEPDETAPWQQDIAAALQLARYYRHRMPLGSLLTHVWHKVRTSHAGRTDPT